MRDVTGPSSSVWVGPELYPGPGFLRSGDLPTAWSCFEKGMVSEAAWVARNYTMTAPGDPEGLLLLARCEMARGRTGYAASYLGRIPEAADAAGLTPRAAGLL